MKYEPQAALPVYILHQTLIVVIAFYIINTGIAGTAGYLVVNLLSLPVCLLMYKLCIRRFNQFRPLFGMETRHISPTGR